MSVYMDISTFWCCMFRSISYDITKYPLRRVKHDKAWSIRRNGRAAILVEVLLRTRNAYTITNTLNFFDKKTPLSYSRLSFRKKKFHSTTRHIFSFDVPSFVPVSLPRSVAKLSIETRNVTLTLKALKLFNNFVVFDRQERNAWTLEIVSVCVYELEHFVSISSVPTACESTLIHLI